MSRLAYHDRYGYPLPTAVAAEAWWRLEHTPTGPVARLAYRRRKAAEHRGSSPGGPRPPRRTLRALDLALAAAWTTATIMLALLGGPTWLIAFTAFAAGERWATSWYRR